MKDFKYDLAESSEEDNNDHWEENSGSIYRKYGRRKKASDQEIFYSFQGTSLSKPPPTSILPSSPPQKFSTSFKNSSNIADLHSLPGLAQLSTLPPVSRSSHSNVPTPKYSDIELVEVEDYSDEKESSFLTPDLYASAHFPSNVSPINRSFSEQLTTQDVLSRSLRRCTLFCSFDSSNLQNSMCKLSAL